MARKPFDLNSPDDLKHAGPMAVCLYEYEEEGRKQTAVLLHRPLPSGEWSREMVCDLDRMEAALKHGRELFAPFADVREPMEKVVGSISHGTWNVRYVVRAYADRPAEMVVAIDQDHPKGRQLLGCKLDELEEATKHAQNFERERSHERPPWYQVVRCGGLEQGDSVARLHVVRTLPREEAVNFAAKNWRSDGTVFYEQPTRRRVGEDGGGYVFSTSLENALRLAPKLKTEIDYIKVERERRTPQFLIGVWHDQGIEPRPDTPVLFDEYGRDVASRQATPYRVTKADNNKPRGPGESPIYVIVEIDQGHPPIHRLRHVLGSEPVKPDSPPGGPSDKPDSPPGGVPLTKMDAYRDFVRVHRDPHAERPKLERDLTERTINLGGADFTGNHRPKL